MPCSDLELEERNDFQFGGASFGWKAIEDMYVPDCNRWTSGAARMVPNMKIVYILRDSWTKLNVAPADHHASKIFIFVLFSYKSVL